MQKLASILILIACSLIATSCQEAQEYQSEEVITSSVVAGEYVAENKFEQVVGISKRNKLACTGTLIAKNKILTASHCFSFVPTLKTAYNINKELVENSLNNTTTLEEEFDRYLENVLDEERRSYRVFTGNGVKGGYIGIKGIKRYLIESIQISTKQYESYKYALLNGDLDPRTFTEKFTEDWAIITIKENIDHIKPTPLLSEEEMIQTVQESSSVTVVGYGLEASQEMIDKQYRAQQRASKECIENFNACKQYAYESITLTKLQDLFKTSGLKKSTQLDINSIDLDDDNHMITLKDPNDESGVCNGDSGGPAFANIDGELKLIGVNVAVTKCDELSFTGLHSTETTHLEKSKILNY